MPLGNPAGYLPQLPQMPQRTVPPRPTPTPNPNAGFGGNRPNLLGSAQGALDQLTGIIPQGNGLFPNRPDERPPITPNVNPGQNIFGQGFPQPIMSMIPQMQRPVIQPQQPQAASPFVTNPPVMNPMAMRLRALIAQFPQLASVLAPYLGTM